ncbi:MAG: hypothetical protein FWG42_06815 [Clostridiales bacterium]|nr:hypothetical protein [Clostridiales bacterium]
MLDVIFYSDSRGKEPTAEFISELRQNLYSPSHFTKKTNKTPLGEIEQAKRNLADYIERNGE